MFYNRYIFLCDQIGKKPYTVAKELGLGNSNVAQWKKGSTPRPSVIKKMAEYFDVSMSYLMAGEERIKRPSAQTGGGLDEEIISRLLRLTPEELQKVDGFVQGLLANRSK